ncbi:conserved hypothetical protein [Xenorhabdus bovienii str. Intermedium]|nr:conserved hypothetical protein [Xenorhabdus bovienii str. Intermedium]
MIFFLSVQLPQFEVSKITNELALTHPSLLIMFNCSISA